MVRRSLDDPSLVLNREASWLAFNRRVLEEAENHHNPLLERVKFLAITARNLDEFFEIRVGGLMQRIEDGHTESGPTAAPPGRKPSWSHSSRTISCAISTAAGIFLCGPPWRMRAFAWSA